MANRMPGITLEGDEEFAALVKQLPNVAISDCSKALRKVGKGVVSRARSMLRKGAGVRSGQLRKSIGVRSVKAYRKENKVVMYIGPRKGFETRIRVLEFDAFGRKRVALRKIDPTKYAHLVEFGHRIAVGQSGRSENGYKFTRTSRIGKVYRAKGYENEADNAGVVKAIPFLRNAIDGSKIDFLSELKAALKLAVEARVMKGLKKLNIPRWQGEGKRGSL